jgi:hypothetical protein
MLSAKLRFKLAADGFRRLGVADIFDDVLVHVVDEAVAVRHLLPRMTVAMLLLLLLLPQLLLPVVLLLMLRRATVMAVAPTAIAWSLVALNATHRDGEFRNVFRVTR